MFFKKNRIDLDFDAVTVTATQDTDNAIYCRNRSLQSAYVTNGSVDSDNTEINIDLADPYTIDYLLLLGHNFASYKLEYYNGSSWVSVVDQTSNANASTSHELSSPISASLWKLTIRGTIVSDSDKLLQRLVLTEKLGQFSYWPKIKKPMHDAGKIVRKALSGKKAVARQVGFFKFSLEVSNWKGSDLTLVETLYNQFEGFEVWLGAGDEAQFSFAAEGYRKKDLYLMQCVNDYSPEFLKGIYVNGLDLDIALEEVVF
jgi:hypothetical protein